MNKHIFEFDKQAQEYAAMELATVNTGGLAEFNRLYRNKFAELIVRECMKLNSKELSITAIERLLPLYEEHFGVEE